MGFGGAMKKNSFLYFLLIPEVLIFISCSLGIFFKTSILQAQESISEESQKQEEPISQEQTPPKTLAATKSPHHKGRLSSINLGIRYSSVLENRGVIFYKDYQIDPVVAVFFLDDKVEFLGDSIGYRDFLVGKWLRYRTRLVSITDDPLFPDKESVKIGFPDRPDTYEWSHSLEFFLPEYNNNYRAEIDLTYSKDLYKTYGNYVELLAKVKLFEFRLPYSGVKIEPNFFSLIGWGDKAHNQYFYGPSADQSGFNNFGYGLWMAFPEESDRFYPIIQLRRFQVLGDNQRAEYAKDKSDGWLFSLIATFGLLE